MPNHREFARHILASINSKADNTIWFSTAIVTEIRKSDRRIRVKILPEELETNFIKVFYPLAGPNYMIGALPEVGSEVALLFYGADPNHAFAIGGTFFDDDVPPEIQQDHDLVIHPKHGGWIHITKDNGIIINTDKDISVSVSGNVTATVDGETVVKCDDIYFGDKTNSGDRILTKKFLDTKYNIDMELVKAHSNYFAPDATLIPIGNANITHCCQTSHAK